MPQPTKEQLQIFEFVQKSTGHGIIDAVAGSGKTTTIIDSASHLHPGQRALFCAFNNSIAKEIQKRFTERNNNQVTVKTIHALGYDILKSNTPGDYKVIPQKV